jgi:hypothetical protein
VGGWSAQSKQMLETHDFMLEQGTDSPVLSKRTELRRDPVVLALLSLLSVSDRLFNSDGYSY